MLPADLATRLSSFFSSSFLSFLLPLASFHDDDDSTRTGISSTDSGTGFSAGRKSHKPWEIYLHGGKNSFSCTHFTKL